MEFTLYPSFACAPPLPSLLHSSSAPGLFGLHARHGKADTTCAESFRALPRPPQTPDALSCAFPQRIAPVMPL